MGTFEGEGVAMDAMERCLKEGNTKLILQNCIMMRENERLRKLGALLEKENEALLSKLKQVYGATTSPHSPNAKAAPAPETSAPHAAGNSAV